METAKRQWSQDLEALTNAIIETALKGVEIENTSFDFSSLFTSYQLEHRKTVFEVAFRRAVRKSLKVESEAVYHTIDAAIVATRKGLADPGLPFLLVEEWMEVIPVWKLDQVFNYLEARMRFLSDNISSSKGKGLILLRLCNEMIRRLSKSQDSSLCGRILLLISKAFPSNERSGVNLRGDLNLDNTTPIDEKIATVIDPDLYKAFWRLQFFMYHPIQALISENWAETKNCLEGTVELFEKNKPLEQASEEKVENYFPKYLSDSRLFDLQISDPTWREVVLVQMAVFVQHLLAFSSKEEFKPPSAKALSVGLLSSEQEEWLNEFNRKLMRVVSSSLDGVLCNKILKFLLRAERHWMSWKACSCPSYEKQPMGCFFTTNPKEPLVDLGRLLRPNFIGSEELTRLWSTKSDLEEPRCVLSSFLAPLIEQLDPSQGIEEEYRQSRNEIYRWKFLRLLVHEDLALEHFSSGNSSEALDRFCDAARSEMIG